MTRSRETAIGERFGRLTITGERIVGSPPRVPVRCDCGTERLVRTNALGRTQSCGCLQREIAAANTAARTTHGMANTTEYHIWGSMKQRTTNPNHKHWASYGGRGIRMCDRWLNSFEAFLADVGPRPEGRTLDRLDNDGNYEPGNVGWRTWSEQAKNRRPQLRDTCINDHLRTPENTRTRRDGTHACRTCDNEVHRAKYIPRQRVPRPPKTELAPRMLEALALAATGMRSKEINEAMGLPPNSASAYLSIARTRLGAVDRAGAIRIAQERGLIPAVA